MRMVGIMIVMTAKAAPPSAPAGTRTAFTSVPVKPETLKRLRSYKVGGRTYDDVLNEFMDGTPTQAFWKEMDRRLREEPDVPWEKVRRKLKL